MKKLLIMFFLITGVIFLTGCKKEPLSQVVSNSKLNFIAKKLAQSVVSIPKTGEEKQISDRVEIKKR